jgi:hypothetical protein
MSVQQLETEQTSDTPGLIVETVPRPENAGQQPQSPAEDQDGVGQALGAVVHGLERQIERRLPALIVAALGLIFSETVESAIRRRMDDAVHAAVTAASETPPDAPLGQEAVAEAENVVRSILHDLLDSLFTGSIRAKLDHSGREIAEALLRKDGETAREISREALGATLRDALEIVQEHRGEITRAALTALTKAGGEMVAGKIEDGVEDTAGTIKDGAKDAAGTVEDRTEEATATPIKAVTEAVSRKVSANEAGTGEDQKRPAERSRSTRRRADDRGEDIRDQMTGIGDTLRRQIEQETKGLKDRLSGGVQKGAKEGMRNQQLGRPPSVRSSNRSTPGRPPARRRPPTRPSRPR